MESSGTPQKTRWALKFEYDGSAFHGFQRQPADHGPTVQGTLEAALSRILDTPTSLICAGRTDTGVHATGQVVHFDAETVRPERAWTRGLDSMCGPALNVYLARPVADDFHARFSARRRRYVYVLDDSGRDSPVMRSMVGRSRQHLNCEAMHQAAGALVGTHDFSSFRAAGCQARSPVRTIVSCTVTRQDPWVVFDVEADGFLQHMVRNLVGALSAVGRGEVQSGWLSALLAARDRTQAPPTASPAGLYLVDVSYDSITGINTPAKMPPMLG